MRVGTAVFSNDVEKCQTELKYRRVNGSSTIKPVIPLDGNCLHLQVCTQDELEHAVSFVGDRMEKNLLRYVMSCRQSLSPMHGDAFSRMLLDANIPAERYNGYNELGVVERYAGLKGSNWERRVELKRKRNEYKVCQPISGQQEDVRVIELELPGCGTKMNAELKRYFSESAWFDATKPLWKHLVSRPFLEKSLKSDGGPYGVAIVLCSEGDGEGKKRGQKTRKLTKKQRTESARDARVINMKELFDNQGQLDCRQVLEYGVSPIMECFDDPCCDDAKEPREELYGRLLPGDVVRTEAVQRHYHIESNDVHSDCWLSKGGVLPNCCIIRCEGKNDLVSNDRMRNTLPVSREKKELFQKKDLREKVFGKMLETWIGGSGGMESPRGSRPKDLNTMNSSGRAQCGTAARIQSAKTEANAAMLHAVDNEVDICLFAPWHSTKCHKSLKAERLSQFLGVFTVIREEKGRLTKKEFDLLKEKYIAINGNEVRNATFLLNMSYKFHLSPVSSCWTTYGLEEPLEGGDGEYPKKVHVRHVVFASGQNERNAKISVPKSICPHGVGREEYAEQVVRRKDLCRNCTCTNRKRVLSTEEMILNKQTTC
jgi:hypothetical protein